MTKQIAVIAALSVVIIAATVAWWGLRDPIWLYLVSVNFAAMGFVGWDKGMAGLGARRIPERILLGLAFAGGSPGAWTSMQICRHKTVKRNFRAKFFALTALQTLLICAIVYWRLKSS